MLLHNGAKIDDYDYGAQRWAIEYNQIEMVSFLMSQIDDVNTEILSNNKGTSKKQNLIFQYNLSKKEQKKNSK